MELQQEILINKYGQDIIESSTIIDNFLELHTREEQFDFLDYLLFCIMQSKPINDDIDKAILNSGLKSTYTPCVILKKGVDNNNLKKIVQLPDNERLKGLNLLLSLFKIAYKRRFISEKNHPNKWWYWDLTDPELENKVYKL